MPCILLAIILGTSITEAQLIKAYGFKAGTVAATQSFDYSINVSIPTDNGWGIDVGGFVEFFHLPFFSLLTELHYTQKGFSTALMETTPAQPEGTGRYITIRPRTDYLSIPILAKLRFDNKPVTPYVFLGPRFDFLLSTESSLDYSSTDVGATLGGGIQFSIISVPELLIEGRFSPSFRNVFQNQYLTVKNRSFEILVGATF